jgi:hypothetical protein
MTRDSSKTRGFFSGSALQRGEYGKWRRRSRNGRRRFYFENEQMLYSSLSLLYLHRTVRQRTPSVMPANTSRNIFSPFSCPKSLKIKPAQLLTSI